MKDHFDFLTLFISLWRPKPDGVGSGDFVYRVLWEPYDGSFDFTSRRTIFHETLHYWQLMGCRFLQNLVDEEWMRFLDFYSDSSIIAPPGPLLTLARARDAEAGFSALDLLEGVTRFWEVHPQNARELLLQEAIENQDKELIDAIGFDGPGMPVPWMAIELAMRHGANCDHYGTPFRWCLARLGDAMQLTHEPRAVDAGDGTRLLPRHLASAGLGTCVLFPIVAHLAFFTEDPVLTFKSTIKRMIEENFHWRFDLRFAGMADHVMGLPFHFDSIYQFMQDEGVRMYKSSVDPRSNDKPLEEVLAPFRWCVQRLHAFEDTFSVVSQEYVDELAMELKSFVSHYGVTGAMSLMGLREIRQTLAGVLPPPFVAFPNGETSYPLPQEIAGGPGDAAVRAARLGRTEPWVARFRRAEKAAALGLPLDAFEGQGIQRDIQEYLRLWRPE